VSRLTAIAAALVLSALSAPASGQSWEASGLLGYTPSVSLDRQAPELTQLDIRGGFTWGLQAGHLFTPRWGAELLWMQQGSALRLVTEAGAANVFTMPIQQLQGNVLYHVGSRDTKLRPFVFGGLGATFLSATELESETKVSYGFGGGVKYFPWKNIGARASFRYAPTMLNDDETVAFCDPFGFCQGSLQQIEFAVGAVVRF
jgi:opacity protein-like surface antigen